MLCIPHTPNTELVPPFVLPTVHSLMDSRHDIPPRLKATPGKMNEDKHTRARLLVIRLRLSLISGFFVGSAATTLPPELARIIEEGVNNHPEECVH